MDIHKSGITRRIDFGDMKELDHANDYAGVSVSATKSLTWK
jgi:hypothetical protein